MPASDYDTPQFPGRRGVACDGYERRLPHWRLDGATYLVTWRLLSGIYKLDDDERRLVMGALRYFDGDRCRLFAAVVMDNHVHALVEPLRPWRLEQLTHSWKSYTANRLQRRSGRPWEGAVWQDESFDRVIRNVDEFQQKVHYIMNNPFTRWPNLASYAWVWLHPRLAAEYGIRPGEPLSLSSGTDGLAGTEARSTEQGPRH